MKNKITVVDAICGAGKTSWAIQHMSQAFSGRFIYVTPYLTEIKRVIDSTSGDFKEPNNNNKLGSKIEGLRNLVSRGENIACTHELFKLCDDDLLDLIENEEYTLVLDEVLNVINPIQISKDDLGFLINDRVIEVNKKTGSIKWIRDEYKGEFEALKHLSKNENLFLFNETFVFWTLHKKAFEAFKKICILTYLFDGQVQKYYYDLHGFTFDKKSVIIEDDIYLLVNYNPRLDNRELISKRLLIYEDSGKSKLNSNFCKKPSDYMFSSTWLKNCDVQILDRIRKNINSFFRSVDAGTKNSYWTTTKNSAIKIKGSKNTYYETNKKSNFVSVNIRATNDYKDCIASAYIYNRFMNPIEKAFFNFHGVQVDEESLAISDLVQFLFRGVIRINDSEEKMRVYIPSKRMRKLLYQYLNYEL